MADANHYEELAAGLEAAAKAARACAQEEMGENESSEPPAKNVQEAEKNARGRFRAARRQESSGSNDGKPQ